LNRLTLREQSWIRAVIEDCRGNSSQATEYYKAFLAQYPDDRDGWLRLGWLYMARRGQYENAIEGFKRVLELDPSSSTSYVNIATCYAGLGQYAEARKHYEKGFELAPSDILGYNINSEYGFTLIRLGALQKAAETFRKMTEADEILKKARGYRSMAFLAMYQGKLSEAIANFKRAILINRAEKASDSEFRDHLFLASTYRLKGRNADFSSELEAANRILSLESLDPGFISELATIYARTGKVREASSLLKKMSSQAQNLTALSALNRTNTGDRASISEVKGEIAMANGNLTEAIEHFELMISLEARYPRESLAVAYHRSGRLKDAAGEYEEIIAKMRLSGRGIEYWILAHYELAGIYKELGNTQKAKEYYGKFLSIWSEADPDIPILNRAKSELAVLLRSRR